MTVQETPVLIAGGGPVGLALATELGWRGIPCTLIEQTDGSIHLPKMNEINSRTMEFCRRWGIADQVMNCRFPADHPMDVVFMTSLGGYELGRMERPAKRDQVPGPFSPMRAQICSQQWFDPLLRERAALFPCVSLRYGHRLDGFEVTGDGVVARLTDLADGTDYAMLAHYLVGCDGANSLIREALGIGLEGTEVLGRPLHMFFRTPDLFAQLDLKPGTFFLAIDKDGLWANIRVIDPDDGLWRLMVLDSKADLDPAEIDCDAYLERALGRKLYVEWVGVSVWVRRGVVAERYGDGPVFLAGDAVHQLSPTGALGMNTGIGDAVDLGWKLAATIDGWSGAGLLASYDFERRMIGHRNVGMVTEFYQGHAAFTDGMAAIEDNTPQGAKLRAGLGEALVRDIARMFRSTGLQLGYCYGGSPICVADGAAPHRDGPEEPELMARSGGRAPHSWLKDGRSIIDLFGRGFILLRFGNRASDASALAGAAAARQVPLEVVTLEEQEAAEIYQSKLVLVRPDGHVAWRANEAPTDPVSLIDTVRGA